MPIVVMCANPECGEIMNAPDAAAGKKGRCPFCGMVQDIPAAPAGVQSDLGDQDVPDEEMVVLKDSDWIDSAVRSEQEDAAPPPEQPWDRIVAPDDKGNAEEAAEEKAAEPSSPLDLLTEAEEKRIVSDELKRKQALGDNTGVLAVFFLGFVGLILGAALGWAVLSGRPLLGVYLGGFCGWVIGFILGFVAVVALDRSMELELRGPSQDDYMVRDCLQAYSYRSSGFAGLFVLILASVVVHTLARAAWKCFHLYPEWPAEARWSLLAGAGLLEVLYFGYALRVGLNLVGDTFEGRASAPRVAYPNPLALVATAIQGVGLIALYVLPLITLPLLPLGILGLSYSGGAGAFNLLWARKAGVRWSAVLLTLWLLLLLWSAVLGAVVAVLVLAGNEISDQVPRMPGYQGLIIDLLVFAVRAIFLSAAGAVLGCILFHCVGIFGRHNPVVLRHLPRRITPASAAFLLVGLALLGLIIYRMGWPLRT